MKSFLCVHFGRVSQSCVTFNLGRLDSSLVLVDLLRSIVFLKISFGSFLVTDKGFLGRTYFLFLWSIDPDSSFIV